MTDLEPRSDVVDLLISQDFGEALTPDQVALAATATDAERELATEIEEAEALYSISGAQVSPEDAALAAATLGPPQRSTRLDGLPLDTFLEVSRAQKTWPHWDDDDRTRLAPLMAQWSAQQRAIFQERFSMVCPDGTAHWLD